MAHLKVGLLLLVLLCAIIHCLKYFEESNRFKLVRVMMWIVMISTSLFLFISVYQVARTVQDKRDGPATDARCYVNLRSIHQSDIPSNVCPSKYSSISATIESQATVKWETDGSSAVLNDNCCIQMKEYINHPFLMTSMAAMFLAGNLLVLGLQLLLNDDTSSR